MPTSPIPTEKLNILGMELQLKGSSSPISSILGLLLFFFILLLLLPPLLVLTSSTHHSDPVSKL
jgi:hypothetical protein